MYDHNRLLLLVPKELTKELLLVPPQPQLALPLVLPQVELLLLTKERPRVQQYVFPMILLFGSLLTCDISI